MSVRIACATLVVRDYDEALEYFTRVMGFSVVEDRLEEGKRWLVVAPTPSSETSLLLARASTPAQEACVGNQTGGRVGFFLCTDDFEDTHRAMRRRGVRFLEEPRREPYGTVAVFADLYGNRWDLLETRPAGASGAAVVGLAPHSGWAAAVVLGGSRADPRILGRLRVEMADPRAPGSRQPYHAVEALGLEEAERRLARYRAAAEARAYAAIQALAQDLSARGYRATSVGILESSGRKGASLASILASHALIHTADGDHFRRALAAAAERGGLAVSRVPGRDLEARAEADLGRPLSRLREVIKELGRQVGPPWGADQKMAALMAWLLLDQPDG